MAVNECISPALTAPNLTYPMSDSPPLDQQPPPSLWVAAMPALFVPLWSTGFIGAKYGLPYAEPLTFLCLRYGLVIALVLVAMAILRPPRLSYSLALTSIGVGILIHAGYLGAVFWAISVGMPAGISAVIVGLQPILTAVFAGFLLGERVGRRQWLGLIIGLFGVIAVLWPGIQDILAGGETNTGIIPTTVGVCVGGLLAITLGTILQRAKAQGVPLWSGAFYQYLGAIIATLPLALMFETNHVEWHPDFIFALAWLTLVLSIGAISLLVIMLRHGAASRVATLFYLVPPVAALIAFFLFDERLTLIQLLGMVLAASGVWLATRSRVAGQGRGQVQARP
ncbi:MAG: DMT family transporter [Pseudomonadota bacterium]